MSNYERKLRKVFEQVESQYLYLISHKDPHSTSLLTDIAGSGRDYANMIHDMPNVWTGKASHQAILRKLSNSKFRHSEDHYHSRQRGGEEIVKLIIACYKSKRKPSRREIKAIIDKYCQVHYVTKEENHKLKYTMEPNKTWEQAYKECDVKLVDARELFGKRGRHSEAWKQEMREKFQSIITKRTKKCRTSIRMKRRYR